MEPRKSCKSCGQYRRKERKCAVKQGSRQAWDCCADYKEKD